MSSSNVIYKGFVRCIETCKVTMNSMIPTRYIDVALDSMGKHVEYVEHFDL